VAWSERKKEEFTEAYWNKLWGWYARGGKRHVAAYLAELDLSNFDAKAPPPKMAAFYAIVDVGQAPEVAEMADLLDRMDNPDVVTLAMLLNAAGHGSSFYEWLDDRKNRRVIPHRLEQCGYVKVRNDAADDGLFVVDGRRQVIYARSDLTAERRMRAAKMLVEGEAWLGRRKKGGDK
jgi:hypothetical protein